MRSTLSLVAVLSLAASTLSAQKADFSGTWKLNTEQSDAAAPPGGGQGGGRGMGAMAPAELVIVQSADKIVIESKMGDQSRSATYLLNGSDSKNPGRGGEVTTKTTWKDNTLVTHGENTMSMGGNEMTITTHEVRSLSADGKQMTVVTTTSTPRGERTRKLVYDKA